MTVSVTPRTEFRRGAILAASLLLLHVGGSARAQRVELPVTQPMVELEVPPKVGLGDTVEVTLRVRNDGSTPINLEIPGRPAAFDIVIVGPDGTEVWRRLRDAVLGSALMLLRLEPGRAHEFTARWAQADHAGLPVAPGRYTVQGILPVGSRRLTTAPRSLLIEG